jgi:hypothetical protein
MQSCSKIPLFWRTVSSTSHGDGGSLVLQKFGILPHDYPVSKPQTHNLNPKQVFNPEWSSPLHSLLIEIQIAYFHCLSPDPTHCGNMTEATMIYDTCISTVTAQNGFLQLQESWVPIVIILSITPVAVTLLFCLAIRYQKRKSRKSNAKVNSDYDANDPSET